MKRGEELLYLLFAVLEFLNRMGSACNVPSHVLFLGTNIDGDRLIRSSP